MKTKPQKPAEFESAEPACFGNLFPDFSKLEHNRRAEGQAFDVLIESCGVGVQRKTIVFKANGWAQCASAPGFDECYRLSIAKLLLELKLDRYA